jgi:hypothetical protein
MPGPNSHTHSPLEIPGIGRYDNFDLLPYVIPLGIWPGTTVEPVAKRAYFTHFTVPRERQFKFLRWVLPTVGTGTEDKWDGAILRVNGAKLERLGSSGLVKQNMTVSGVKKQEFTTTVTCEPGVIYRAGLGCEIKTGTPSLAAIINNSGFYGDIGGAGTLANRLFTFKAESIAIPETVEAILEASATVTPWMVLSEI